MLHRPVELARACGALQGIHRPIEANGLAAFRYSEEGYAAIDRQRMKQAQNMTDASEEFKKFDRMMRELMHVEGQFPPRILFLPLLHLLFSIQFLFYLSTPDVKFRPKF